MPQVHATSKPVDRPRIHRTRPLASRASVWPPLSRDLRNDKRPKVCCAQLIRMTSARTSDRVPHGSTNMSDTLICVIPPGVTVVAWWGYVFSAEDILELINNIQKVECTLLQLVHRLRVTTLLIGYWVLNECMFSPAGLTLRK